MSAALPGPVLHPPGSPVSEEQADSVALWGVLAELVAAVRERTKGGLCPCPGCSRLRSALQLAEAAMGARS